MPALSKRTWLGIAREAIPGTAITTPTRYLPCKSTVKGMVKNVILDEERGTRDAAYGHVQTTREGSIDVKGSFYPDSFGYLLLGALGSETSTQPDSTGNPLVYKHAFSLADIPPSFTCLKNYDTKAYYMPYSVVEKVSIKESSKNKALNGTSSRKEGIVPLTMKGVRNDEERAHFLIGDLAPCWIHVSVEAALYSQPSLGGGCCDQFHDHGIIHQRLAAPVLTDPGKEAMLNFIPFAGSWR